MYVPLPVGREHDHRYSYSSNQVEVDYSYDFNWFDRLLFFTRVHKIEKALEKPWLFGAPDLIHCHYLFNSGCVARKIKRKDGVKYLSAFRNSDIGYFRFMPHLRSLGLKIMSDASYIIFLSPAYQKTVFEKYVPGPPSEELAHKSMIIPNGISDFWLANAPNYKKKGKDSAIRLLFVGEWIKRKNIETIVKVVDHLRSKGHKASLLIVGDGPTSKKVHELAACRPDYVATHPWVADQKELLALYRSCDVFVMPSFNETFGLVYIEAMSQGLPVVYTRGQGIDGYYDDGVIGYGCPPRSVESIAQSIEKIMADYDNISRNCIEASQRFNWTDIAREYNRLYESLR
jgi:glycosyltransferase involved in cell wall biosynthesis